MKKYIKCIGKIINNRFECKKTNCTFNSNCKALKNKISEKPNIKAAH